MWGTNFHTFFRVALIAKIVVSTFKNPLECAYQYLQHGKSLQNWTEVYSQEAVLISKKTYFALFCKLLSHKDRFSQPTEEIVYNSVFCDTTINDDQQTSLWPNINWRQVFVIMTAKTQIDTITKVQILNQSHSLTVQNLISEKA